MLAGAPLPAARAHVVYGRPTLHQMTLAADLVARARVTAAHAVASTGDPPLRRPIVVVEVLETLKGRATSGRLRFAQHGHGVAEYAEGEEVLVFLERIERVAELARTPLAGEIGWVSRQEGDAKLVLDDGSRPAFTAAVRDYAALDAAPDPTAAVDGLRRLTVELLGSAHPWLAASALRDLVIAADAPLVTADDVPSLARLLDDRTRAIGLRIGLLSELERRRLVDAPERWARLLRESTGSDRGDVVRAVAAHPSPPVRRELLDIVDGADLDLAAAAAVSLGVPGDDAAVPSLTRALAREDPRLRNAAIRGLGRIETASSRRALELASQFHPDQGTRRRASAELTVLARRRGATGTGEGPAPAHIP